MKIILASYQSIMLIRGGPSYKIVETKKCLEKNGIDVHYFDAFDENLELLKADLVHLFAANIATYSLAKNLKHYGIKFVVNPIFFSGHSPTLLRIYQNFEKPFHKLFKRTYSDYSLSKQICECAELVLPNTRAEVNLISKGLRINPSKIQVIHNGVEDRFLNSDVSLFEQKYGIKDFILYVGHIGGPRKNVLSLIKALSKINHPAVIIGDIAHTKESKICLQEAKKNNNLIIIEGLSHDDPLLESAYAACDTFVLPSRYETPGRAALEAGLAGAKIVITKYGGTKEYFENMAEYVDPYSIKSIIRGIEKGLNQKKNDRLKNHIKENFIWEKIIDKTIQMYKEVLNI
ncbi:MAG: glycosyltransferase [Candidatus Cloacimonetes bacterium]|nr:glycosyltransferase [Candidatus Cloacimonadota bacterium]MBL7086605.1 glycosyltransferase [Candidatus Cloacimonadota bacterium]